VLAASNPSKQKTEETPMKKSLKWTVFAVVLAALAMCCGYGVRAAHAQQLNNTMPPTQWTVAHEALDAAQGLGVKKSDYKMLEALLSTIELKTRPFRHNGFNSNERPETALSILDAIQKVVTKDSQFTERVLLHESLRKRQFNCSTLTTLFVAAGQRMKLPISAADAPRHAFVRWTGKTFEINWETTIGKPIDTAVYKRMFNIDERAVHKGTYLRTLSVDEVRAYALNTAALEWHERGETRKAVEFLQKAIMRRSRMVAAYSNAGAYFVALGDYTMAFRLLNDAIDLDPHNTAAYFNRGILLELMNRNDDAIASYTAAIESDPSFSSAYRRRAGIFLDENKEALFRRDFGMAILLQLNPRVEKASH
jgi:tetratricopeptide (TPR) repeat protein